MSIIWGALSTKYVVLLFAYSVSQELSCLGFLVILMQLLIEKSILQNLGGLLMDFLYFFGSVKMVTANYSD